MLVSSASARFQDCTFTACIADGPTPNEQGFNGITDDNEFGGNLGYVLSGDGGAVHAVERSVVEFLQCNISRCEAVRAVNWPQLLHIS